MLNTSTFTPNVLTHDQVAELQAIFNQVCGEFEIRPDDREYRDRIAESLMAAATSGHVADAALEAARAVARDIVHWRKPK